MFTTELGAPSTRATCCGCSRPPPSAANIEGVGVAHAAALRGGGMAGGRRAHQGRRGSARAFVIAITGDVYGHTSDDTARAAVDGLAGRLGL